MSVARGLLPLSMTHTCENVSSAHMCQCSNMPAARLRRRRSSAQHVSAGCERCASIPGTPLTPHSLPMTHTCATTCLPHTCATATTRRGNMPRVCAAADRALGAGVRGVSVAPGLHRHPPAPVTHACVLTRLCPPRATADQALGTHVRGVRGVPAPRGLRPVRLLPRHEEVRGPQQDSPEVPPAAVPAARTRESRLRHAGRGGGEGAWGRLAGPLGAVAGFSCSLMVC